MKRRLILLAPGVVLAVLVTLLAAQTIGAQGGDGLRTVSPVGQELEGTWVVDVTLENPPPGIPPNFPTMNTFLPSGELLETGAGTAPSRRTPGHGEWVRTGDRRFAATLMWFRFDAEGRYIGTQTAHEQIRLRRNLRQFRGTSLTVIRDPEGNVLATSTARLEGTRIEVHEPADDEDDAGSETPAED